MQKIGYLVYYYKYNFYIMKTIDIKKFEIKKNTKPYQPNKDDKTKTTFIKQRFSAMQTSRAIVDRSWETYQTMIDAIFEPYPDWRSSSVVPLASAIIELYVAETLKLKPQFQFKAENTEHNWTAKALEFVWKYDWRRNKRDKEFLRNEYITAWFWTSVIYSGYEKYEYKQEDPIMWDDMVFTFKENTYTEENIIVKNIDIRDFYPDNHIREDFDEANDCIYIQYVSYDKFKTYKNNKFYKNIDDVTSWEYTKDTSSFYVKDEQTSNASFVKLMHYWNLEKDAYIVIANDGTIVREHPILTTKWGKKALPFTMRPLGYRNYSCWGVWLCERLMMFNSELNNFRETLMDAIKRSNQQVLAIWNWLTFDWRSFSYDNEILSFDWQLAWNFEQISGNWPNPAIFNFMDRLYKDIAIYVWIDIQNIIWEPQQTAFQTEVQREASQKRVNTWITNRDLAFERFADLYADLLRTFFPRKTAEWLYPKIEIENWTFDKSGKFKKTKSKSMFEVTPEVLQWEVYIDVHTNTTAPTINAVDRQQKLDLLQTIWTISQWYALAKQAGTDLEDVLPLKQTIRDLASDYNLTPISWDKEWVKEWMDKLKNELKAMMMNPWQQQPTAIEQPLPTNEMQWPTNL